MIIGGGGGGGGKGKKKKEGKRDAWPEEGR